MDSYRNLNDISISVTNHIKAGNLDEARNLLNAEDVVYEPLEIVNSIERMSLLIKSRKISEADRKALIIKRAMFEMTMKDFEY